MTLGIFDTGIFDTGIFDHAATVPIEPDRNTGGAGKWLDHRPQYRRFEEYDEPKPEKPRKKKKRKDGPMVVLVPDPVIQTGIIEVRPAWDALVDLQRQQEEAAIVRQRRLRAIALADDEWMMMS